eukprot:CCRYP_020239-RA/>CCRYP_020239-RA protein AED:0.58 eAED:0.68 QI:0/-1/0/1/-1/0/1/0/488
MLCITRASLDDHLDHLRLVLTRLQDVGLRVNAPKSKFCAVETEYLGYILTRTGLKPQPNKVQAILAISPPKQVKDLRRFLGMVQNCRDLRARRSEMLAPLTSLVGECGHTKVTKAKKTKKQPWYWDEVHQIAFDNVKAAIAKDEVLAYPDFLKEFEIYTDASSKQLGSVITQGNRPLAFFSRKLSETQQKYSVVITNPWEALCVDLIGPYTLKGKAGTEIDFMCLTMINPASSWFEVVELPITTDAVTPTDTKGQKGTKTHTNPKLPYFDKSSTMINNLVNKTWFSRYPRCQYIIYDNGSKFKLHFEALCESYGIKRKPTSVKNPQANAILERVHQVITVMLRTTEIDMANTVVASDLDVFLTNAAWAICSTYHTVLKASPGTAIFGRDMLFDVPFLANWNKIGEHRQYQTDLNTMRENHSRRDWDYKVGDQVLLRKDGILRKSESRYESDPWTITTIHTNGTIRVQRRTKSERLNIRRVTPFFYQHT